MTARIRPYRPYLLASLVCALGLVALFWLSGSSSLSVAQADLLPRVLQSPIDLAITKAVIPAGPPSSRRLFWTE